MSKKEIVKKLFENQDKEYRDFTANLSPTVDKKNMIGVRMPVLKKLAKEFVSEKEFLNDLPHKYFEEYNLHAFMLNNIKDYDEAIKEVEKFLPYVNNWATCDTIKVKCFAKHKEELIKKIKEWIKSKHEYTVRFGVSMLMSHYLNEDFKEEHLKLVGKIKSDAYYINMMRAWYYATALAKQWDATFKYLKENKLDDFTLKKTISKAKESFRVSEEHKKQLEKLV